MTEKFLVEVSEKAVKHGFSLGCKVYEDKKNFRDKTHWGGANELQADVFGFVAESVVCDFFEKPLPEFKPQVLDDFDVELKGLKLDVKKVGFSRRTGEPKITINKRQFFRKKDKIDGFLFASFEGAFEQIEVDGLRVHVPVAGKSKLWLLGWIRAAELEEKAKLYIWRDRDTGEAKDEGLQLELNDLVSVKGLV